MDGAEARELEEADEVDLAGLLERHDVLHPRGEIRRCSAQPSTCKGCFKAEPLVWVS